MVSSKWEGGINSFHFEMSKDRKSGGKIFLLPWHFFHMLRSSIRARHMLCNSLFLMMDEASAERLNTLFKLSKLSYIFPGPLYADGWKFGHYV